MNSPTSTFHGEPFVTRYELRAPARDRGLAEAWDAVERAVPERPLLIKILPAGVRAPEPWSAVLERLGRLGNPQLPRVVAAGESADRRPWIALEALEGRSLADWLDGHVEAGTSPGLGVVLWLFDAISRAVQVGHGAGGRAEVLHRGLSPRSVILKASAGGHQVRVLDHELAPFLGASGSREHMAPEQDGTRGGETAATDVFSLGVILTELLSLRATPHPDGRTTWWEFVRGDSKRLARHLAGLRGDVPLAVWEVVAQAMQPDPAARFSNAQSFARRLRQVIPPEWKQLPAVEREPPAPTRPRASVSGTSPQRRDSASAPVGWVDAERTSIPIAARPLDDKPGPPAVMRAPTRPPPSGPMASAPLPAAPSPAESELVTLFEYENDAPRRSQPKDDGEATLVDAAPPSEDASATLLDAVAPSATRPREPVGESRRGSETLPVGRAPLPEDGSHGRVRSVTLQPVFRGPTTAAGAVDGPTIPGAMIAPPADLLPPVAPVPLPSPPSVAERSAEVSAPPPPEEGLPTIAWVALGVGVVLVGVLVVLLLR